MHHTVFHIVDKFLQSLGGGMIFTVTFLHLFFLNRTLLKYLESVFPALLGKPTWGTKLVSVGLSQ